MCETVDSFSIRDRLRDLNSKAYYLLVALAFMFYHGTAFGFHWCLKWALILTAVVAVLPVQDFFESRRSLGCIRWCKVALLIGALILTVTWILLSA